MSDNRTRLWFALFVLAVFCMGAAAGLFIGGRLGDGDRPGRFGGPRGGLGPGGSRGGPGGGPPSGMLIERLTRDLDLTADQRAQVTVILRASRERVEQLQRDVRGRFDREQRTLHEEIRQVLTPSQQERFEQMVERSRRGRSPGRGRGQDR